MKNFVELIKKFIAYMTDRNEWPYQAVYHRPEPTTQPPDHR